MVPLKHKAHIWPYLRMIPVYKTPTAKRVMLRESCSEPSRQQHRGVSNEILVNGDKTPAIYFSSGHVPVEFHLTLTGQNIPFVNHVIVYIRIIFDVKITWRLHTTTMETKAFGTFIRSHSLFRLTRLLVSANTKLTLHEALIRSAVAYVCLACQSATNSMEQSPS